jgi:acyl dehydratase
MASQEFEVKGIREGEEISGRPKKITLDRMRKFSGHLDGGENIHTNEAMAEEAGLPGPIAQGMMSYGSILETILATFGDKWLKGGELEVSFLRYVLPGDTVTAKILVRQKEATDSGSKITLEVWCENQRKEKVVAGTARGIV